MALRTQFQVLRLDFLYSALRTQFQMLRLIFLLYISALRTQFQPHQDLINTLEICERNERLIIISASSDCSVSLWDVHGTRIGTFGQVCWYSP